MSGVLFYLPNARQLSVSGRTLPGWYVQFYLTETTTPTPVYADGDLDVELENPVVADLAGQMPPIYMDPDVIYRVQIYDADGVLQPDGDIDPFDVSRGSGVVETIVAGTNVTVDSTDPANPIVSASGGGSGKMAFACVDESQTILAGSQNVDGVMVLGPGSFVVDFTSAGFTTLPAVCLTHASNEGSFTSGFIVEVQGITTTECQIQMTNGGTPLSEGFNIIAIGL